MWQTTLRRSQKKNSLKPFFRFRFRFEHLMFSSLGLITLRFSILHFFLPLFLRLISISWRANHSGRILASELFNLWEIWSSGSQAQKMGERSQDRRSIGRTRDLSQSDIHVESQSYIESQSFTILNTCRITILH